MIHEFVKVAAATPEVKVCDVDYNVEQIKALIKKASKAGSVITVFPELCITGYSCGELFLQRKLLSEAKRGLKELVKETRKANGLYFFGLPLEHKGKLYNVAVAVSKGQVLGLVPKTYLPNYAEFYEARYFASGKDVNEVVSFLDEEVSLSTELLFKADGMEDLVVAAEICEDLWTPLPPSTLHAMAGATVIVNLSASDAIIGKADYRRDLVKNQSARLNAAYIYCSAGLGESTMDVVYSGHNIIAENGTILSESREFTTGISYSEIDLERLAFDRRKKNTYQVSGDCYEVIDFPVNLTETMLTRFVTKRPFVPEGSNERNERCEEILNIQAEGLRKRLKHIGCKTVVVGISGGLDSTLALLVTVKAFDLLKLDRAGIIAVTMPGFGTTDRTYENACSLVKSLKASLREIPIGPSVTRHFEDIGQDINVHDVTYENGQARERTQILMDLANKEGGIVIGTGDMSELALGFATYNGDHMSMYGVNVSIPKTLVRHLVRYYADSSKDKKLKAVLLDILDTPVSPELLPPTDGNISQVTESIVGPYELHDFVLYYMLRFGFAPGKIYRLACHSFRGSYDQETILYWMKTFYRRFFSQQFKRSCLPDGPKVGTIAISPRGDLRMPSDASGSLWIKELEEL